jgi:hypothetical protein
MDKKPHKQTKAELEAGAKNLAKWQAENPQGGNLKHGAYSRHFRKRYSDKRTTEGKQLAAALQNLVRDIGPDLSAGQCLLLDRIREKLIVLMQIGKYADQQLSLINEKGELLPCLGRNYTSFSEALRRDVEAIYNLATKKSSRIPSIKDIIEQSTDEHN